MKQYYICYPEGKFKALTFSYDDGKKSDRRLVEIFDRYGMKGTFHLNGGLFSDPERIPEEEVAALYAGHELACHTYTHPTIARCPLDKVTEEILEDRCALEALVPYPVQGFSYPNGSYTEAIKRLLPALGIEYGRIVGSSHNFSLPNDWYEWQATCHHNHDLLKHGETFIGLSKKQYLHLMYVWGHSYEFDNDGNWDLIESFCRATGNRTDIWYCTNIEFKRYMSAARRLIFSVSGETVLNPSDQPIWVTIDGEIKKLHTGLNTLA